MKAFTLPQTSSYLAAIEQALTAGSALNDELDATRNTGLCCPGLTLSELLDLVLTPEDRLQGIQCPFRTWSSALEDAIR